MGDQDRQRRREAGHLGCPVRQERGRGDEQARPPRGVRARVALAIDEQEEGDHLDGLAEAHVVGQAGAQAQLREEVEPSHAHLLVRPERAVQRAAGVGRRAATPGRAASAARRPATGRPPPRTTRDPRRPRLRRPPAFDARHEAHRFGEGQAVSRGGAFDAPELVDQAAQTLAIDFDPSPPQQRQAVHALEQRADLVGRQRLAVERHVHPEVEQRVESEARRRLGADGGLDGGPGGRPAFHPAGTRTTMPACSSEWTSRSRARASGGVHRSGWKISPASTIAFSHAQLSVARWTGSSSESSRALLAAPAYSRSAWPSGRCCGVACADRPVRVGGQEGERRVGVLAVLGQVEVHAADGVPGGVELPQRVLDGSLRGGKALANRIADRAPQVPKDVRRSGTRRRPLAARPRPRPRVQHRSGQGSAAGFDTPPGAPAVLGLSAERVDVSRREVAPVGERRGKRRLDLAGAELQEPATRAAGEGLAEAGCRGSIQVRRVRALFEDQTPMWRQDEIKGRRAARGAADSPGGTISGFYQLARRNTSNSASRREPRRSRSRSRSYAAWRFSQNRSEVPKNRASRRVCNTRTWKLACQAVDRLRKEASRRRANALRWCPSTRLLRSLSQGAIRLGRVDPVGMSEGAEPKSGGPPAQCLGSDHSSALLRRDSLRLRTGLASRSSPEGLAS